MGNFKLTETSRLRLASAILGLLVILAFLAPILAEYIAVLEHSQLFKTLQHLLITLAAVMAVHLYHFYLTAKEHERAVEELIEATANRFGGLAGSHMVSGLVRMYPSRELAMGEILRAIKGARSR